MFSFNVLITVPHWACSLVLLHVCTLILILILIYTYIHIYIYVAGAVRNGKLGIPWRFSVFHIFGKMNSRSTSPASFMDMLHF